jgi:hypothetical protein
MAQNFAAPIWMTFKQASELDAHIRKGEKGSLVVYADSITRKGTDEKTGDEIDRGNRGVARVEGYRGNFGGAGSDLGPLGAIRMRIVSQSREPAGWVYDQCRF